MRRLSVLLLFFSSAVLADPVFYRSPGIRYENLERQAGQFSITDDKGQSVNVDLFIDKVSTKIYWYRRLFTEVCLTGECRPIDIGIYWTEEGKYKAIEVFRENLTKTDHSDFSPFDYKKLESTLADEWSPLREFEFEELVEEKKTGVDATTGATKKVIADASVKDAVYTTYTMWHLIHVGEGEQLALLTYRYLDSFPGILHSTLESADTPSSYLSFLTAGILAGKLNISPRLIDVILNGLTHQNATYQTNSFNAISLLALNEAQIQTRLAKAYQQWNIADKSRFLHAIAGIQKLSPPLYQALSEDLTQDNAWFLSSLIPVLSRSEKHPSDVTTRIRELTQSDHTGLKESAEKFLVNRKK